MTIDEKIEVLQAFKEGKKIEAKFQDGTIWDTVEKPAFDFANFDYRVKTQPVYKPYSKVSLDMMGKLIARKSLDCHQTIWNINYKTQKINNKTLEELFNYWMYSDGEPFGEIDD